ncbi:MAG: glycosyltransferase [Burkholderiales bacterium]|nr:glycosyltransferase [Burkholderiales bacterium]
MSTTITKKAASLFNLGDYAGAHALYQQASSLYGEKNFSYNLSICKNKLSNQENFGEPSYKELAKSSLNNYFDKIYLVNLKEQVSRRLTAATQLNINGIKFKLVNATNGYKGEALERFNTYSSNDLGTLKRYSSYNEREIRRGKKYIESAGAIGYINTYIGILSDANKNNYNRILILEDDILFTHDFEKKFTSFINSINNEWKILQLGASQYNWASVDINNAHNVGHYYPRCLDTCGSFAIAIDKSIIDELIDAQSAYEAPFDHLPMGEIYERYVGQCFVAYPNIVMPDVADSSIRGGRCQYEHGKKMKWDIDKFNYPIQKPSVSIVISHKDNMRYFNSFNDSKKQPFYLRLFYNSADGLRPLHSTELLEKENIDILPLSFPIALPASDYYLTIGKNAILTETEIVKYIEYRCGIYPKNTTSLESIQCWPQKVVKERVSIIIPTFKRPKNLMNALSSAVLQEYEDLEIIVVSDNGIDSDFNKETREIIATIRKNNTKSNVKFIEHTINRNGSAARNTGLMNSTGEYISFLDDDDIYLEGRISKSIQELSSCKKNIGAVYCGFLGWNSPINDLGRYKSGDLTLELLLLDYKKHYLHTNTAKYKREAITAINGFDESYKRHQDIEFNLRFFEKFQIEVVKDSLVRLNPEPSEVSNKIFNFSMLDLKEKFLHQFEKTITSFKEETSSKIYNIHWSEVVKYINDRDLIQKHMSNNLKNGPLQVKLKLEEQI